MSNKVLYGLKNVHYAVATIDENGKAKYATPVPIQGAVSISLDAEGETTRFYADNFAYFQTNANNGYSGSITLAMIPDDFRTDVLKESLDTNKVMLENGDKIGANFALMFEFTGDSKGVRHVLYNVVCSRPSMEGKTKEESIEVQGETLEITASPLASGYIKARTSDTTTEEAYNAWYTKVYMPTEVADAEENGL